MKPILTHSFSPQEAAKLCLQFRKRILDISQTVTALHIASAYSCMEMVQLIYFSLMRKNSSGKFIDTFLMSKGHGCLAQYVTLEALGILSTEELNRYCKPGGILATHPDYGCPGIEASTGSLGHGLSLSVGMAYADKIMGKDREVYTVLSDGEMQEGSTWEALLIAPSLGVTNIIAFIDLNDFQSLGRTSELHPNFYPVKEKLEAFGWEVKEADGHSSKHMFEAVRDRSKEKPFMLIGSTVKGKGVSFMENVPIWHYRAPSPEEYKQAIKDLEGQSR